jgi:DNA-binding NarL/FixJ family response regulator
MGCVGVSSSPPIRVLLVDDHPAVREGLALLLAPAAIDVCAEAGGRAEALVRVKERRPDVAIVDLSLNGEDGLELIADLHKLAVPVLVYSMHNDAARVASALASGALGYVTKKASHGVLVQGIREVAAGRRFLSPAAAAALADCVTRPSAEDAVQKLSPHERKVYELLGQGQDILDIAATLHVSHHTVESYYGRILVKLNLNGMYELRRHAIGYLHKRTAEDLPGPPVSGKSATSV